jgi:cell division protease FtsH
MGRIIPREPVIGRVIQEMKNKNLRSLFFYAALGLMVLTLVYSFTSKAPNVVEIPYNDLYSSVTAGNVEKVTITGIYVDGTMKDQTKFKSVIPETMVSSFNTLAEKAVQENKLVVEGKPSNTSNWFMDLLLPILIASGLFMFLFFMMSQGSAGGGGNKVMQFGKSRAKMHKEDDQKKITFNDVAGLKEEKEELEEVVDFLKNPKKYRELGARIPKGILMVGPPGTGKTYLSRAVAGEAGVPFFSISGSDFVEMFVGVGASRVRDLFETAKKSAPCIIFIDEIDAVGRKRGAGLGGGHDEREQTLNQLLVEMDGFDENEGIILMAATNRPDILDSALLRPGRFDREIIVGIPDLREREAIVKVHARNKPLEDDVDFEKLARGTTGFTPADLENLMNEAALLTARRGRHKIDMATIQEATTKVIVGLEKKSRVISDKERRITAYHEAGHAILAKLLPEVDPVGQVTIIPRGRAGGFTMQLPQEDRTYSSKKRMEQELIVLLGGRLAEKIVLHDISTGASNDLSRVSEIARKMITKFAFSENLGAMSYDTEEEVFLGKDMTTRRNYSEQVASEIDMEIRQVVDTAFEMAQVILTENIDKLHDVAGALLDYETLYSEEFELVFASGKDALDELMTRKKEAARLSEVAAKHDAASAHAHEVPGAGDISKSPDPAEADMVLDFEEVSKQWKN